MHPLGIKPTNLRVVCIPSLEVFRHCSSFRRRHTRVPLLSCGALQDEQEHKAPEKTLEESISQITRAALTDDPEAAEQIKRYEAALLRLEQARAAQAQLEELFVQASRDIQNEQRQREKMQAAQADAIMANAEVEAAEKLYQAAQLELAAAEEEQRLWQQRAQQDMDRVESLKAGAVSAFGGLLGGLPLTLATSSSGDSSALLLMTASVVASAFLFGVTYRYAVWGDRGNVHLKSGVVAAFIAARVLGAWDMLSPQLLPAEDLAPLFTQIGLYAAQSGFIFAFSATALEAALSRDVVKGLRG